MAAITVTIKNLAALKRNIDRYPQISGKHISKAINQAIFAIEGKAKPITPVKTGRLVGSYSFGRIKSTESTLRGRVMPNVSYAQRVHDLHPPGVSYRNPSKNKNALAGFLQVGAERAEGDIDGFFQDALDNITDDLART